MFQKKLHNDLIILIFSSLLIIYVTLFHNRIKSYYDPLVTRIKTDLMKIDSRVRNLTFSASDESFTEDKKHVYLCLKDRKGEYYDYNMLMYVSLHELAHAFSKTIDTEHKGQEFLTNFQKLLDTAKDKGLYDPNKPLIQDYCRINEKQHQH